MGQVCRCSRGLNELRHATQSTQSLSAGFFEACQDGTAVFPDSVRLWPGLAAGTSDGRSTAKALLNTWGQREASKANST